ncbi:HAD family hydrolase [Neptuniibacter sp. QD29_5]|uniref:HAD family hydrolase n=1 Tax=Neptuniibacter sp. QD29_5 TaxID=3398207 RepID=UPI0039F4A14D
MFDLREKRAWIFDLDGTLTQPVHDFELIRQKLGIDPSDDILDCIKRQSPERQHWMNAELDLLERAYASQAAPADGVLECLEVLAAANCQMGILTRNTHELALLSLKAIGADTFFDKSHVLGREDSQPKPSPEGIHILLKKWELPNHSGVMVGDFHLDLLSGRAAGVSTVHVDLKDRHWPEDTDLRVKNLPELTSLLTLA